MKLKLPDMIERRKDNVVCVLCKGSSISSLLKLNHQIIIKDKQPELILITIIIPVNWPSE
jgi:hypothetical protein